MLPSITTSRLFISKLSLANDGFILQLVNTQGWLQFIGDRNVHNLQQAQDYIEKINSNPSIEYQVVFLKETDAAIGVISFIQRDYLPHPDIGFAFLPSCQKQGYAYEAACAVLQYIASNQHHQYILATTLPHNISSIKLLQRLGFHLQRTLEINHENLLVYSLANLPKIQ